MKKLDTPTDAQETVEEAVEKVVNSVPLKEDDESIKEIAKTIGEEFNFADIEDKSPETPAPEADITADVPEADISLGEEPLEKEEPVIALEQSALTSLLDHMVEYCKDGETCAEEMQEFIAMLQEFADGKEGEPITVDDLEGLFEEEEAGEVGEGEVGEGEVGEAGEAEGEGEKGPPEGIGEDKKEEKPVTETTVIEATGKMPAEVKEKFEAKKGGKAEDKKTEDKKDEESKKDEGKGKETGKKGVPEAFKKQWKK